MYVESCTKYAITFVVMRLINPNTNEKQINKFEFDFRFYNPYSGNDLKKSGLYVFKTTDKDSTPYNHSITSI